MRHEEDEKVDENTHLRESGFIGRKRARHMWGNLTNIVMTSGICLRSFLNLIRANSRNFCQESFISLYYPALLFAPIASLGLV